MSEFVRMKRVCATQEARAPACLRLCMCVSVLLCVSPCVLLSPPGDVGANGSVINMRKASGWVVETAADRETRCDCGQKERGGRRRKEE